MTAQWLTVFEDMQRDINRCLHLDLPEKENVESCFWIAMNYWEEIQNAVMANGFADDAAEISFYKIIKPKFASYIEYFSLVSEGLAFVPPYVPCPAELAGVASESLWNAEWMESVREYWRKEEDRGKRFSIKHKVILDYYMRGDTPQDADYFLARNVSGADLTQRRSHNRDTQFYTVHEEIITSYWAYKLYADYIKKKLEEPIQHH